MTNDKNPKEEFGVSKLRPVEVLPINVSSIKLKNSFSAAC